MPMAPPPMSVIDEIANLLADQKLVPFFGAGLSREILGLGTSELADELAHQLGLPGPVHLADVADLYVARFGEGAFIDLLKSKLLVAAFDDKKAPAHLLLLSLSCHALYTTNQDNIFELCALKYRRPYRRIVTLQDLADVEPGEPRLYKFHGDLDEPTSLVFTTSQYARRITDNVNPFNIRLQSDAIGKRLLFLGYSLQDENVRKLLSEIKHAFNGHLPTSYLVAFDLSVDHSLETDFGLTIISPRLLFPTVLDNLEAFTSVLKTICDKTIECQATRGLEAIFSTGKSYAIKVVTTYEIDALTAIVASGVFETSMKAFLGTLGGADVPSDLEEPALQIFKDIVNMADATLPAQLSQIRAAIFQMKFPPMRAIQALAWFMAFLNRRPSTEGVFDEYVSLVCPVVPDQFMPAAPALAVSILAGRGEAITDGFRRLALWWFRDYEKCPGVTRDNVEACIRAAWQGQPSESPIEYWKKAPAAAFPHKGFHEIMADLQSRLPQRFRSPHDAV